MKDDEIPHWAEWAGHRIAKAMCDGFAERARVVYSDAEIAEMGRDCARVIHACYAADQILPETINDY